MQRWTTEEMERLADLHQSGARPRDIQRALGRTRAQVKNALARMRDKGFVLPARAAGRPSTRATEEMDWMADAKFGSARLRDAMIAYYSKHVWSVAA